MALGGDRTLTIGDGAAAHDLTITAALVDGATPGGLIKTGAGTLALTGANTYTGNTTVSGGTLSLGTATLSDTGTVDVATSASLNLTHGLTDTVDGFYINGVLQVAGEWGSLASDAAHKTARITGSGKLYATNGTGSSDPFVAWIDTFTSLTNPADKTKDADPDLDGMNNLAEFALKGNPDNGSNNGLTAFLLQDTTPPVGNELTYIIAVRDGATFVSGVGGVQTASILADGLSYTVQGSINLVFPGSAVSHVSTSNTAPATTGLPDLTGTSWEYHTFRLNASEGLTGKGFLRVVTQPAP
jgi:autotransporter-associated beta strand protein